MNTKSVCFRCHRAFRYGDEVDVSKCKGCPDYSGAPSYDDLLDDAFQAAQARLATRTEDSELDAYQPAQQSPEREPMRPRVNGWPGRKVRKVKGQRNG